MTRGERDIAKITQSLGGSLRVTDYGPRELTRPRYLARLCACSGASLIFTYGKTRSEVVRLLHSQLRQVAIAFLSSEYDFEGTK